MRLTNQVIIITGSTSGVGAAMAKRFVAENAQVLVHGLDQEAGSMLVEELNGDVKGSAALHIDDLVDPAAASRIVEATLKQFGKIDALVNNAAISERNTLETTSVEFWDRVMAINLRAPMLMVQAASEALLKSKGVVLNTGSICAHCGLPKLMAYSSSKGGLMTLTRNLALSYSTRGVRVNQMNLGWIVTENEHQLQMSEGNPDDWANQVPELLRPSGQLLRPEEVAAAAVYWVSQESRPITGSVFDVEQFPTIGRMPLS